MITVKNVYKNFAERTVLNDVSFSLENGEIVGLVGPSGGGKSVLLKVLGSVIPPTAGSVFYGGSDNRDTQTRIGFLFQEGALFDSMTVIENVAFPLISGGVTKEDKLKRTRVGKSEALDRAYEILGEVGLAQAYKKMPGQLSGGMRRRVGIARALVSRPGLVLLDDPTGGLDPVAASVIIALVKELHQYYLPTVVIVSHDIRRLLPNVNRVLGLFNGEIICDEEPVNLSSNAPKFVVDFLATRFDFSILSN